MAVPKRRTTRSKRNMRRANALGLRIEGREATRDLVEIDEIARTGERLDVSSRIGRLANPIWAGDKPQDLFVHHHRRHRRGMCSIFRSVELKEAAGKDGYVA